MLLIQHCETLCDGFYIDRAHQFANKLELPFESTSRLDAASHFHGLSKPLIVDLNAIEVCLRQAHQTFAHLLQRMHLPFALTFTGSRVIPVVGVTIAHRTSGP